MPTRIIMDVDTGTDDALALTLAALHPELDLIGVTTVNGNVEVEYATENTLRVFDYIGVQVPVYRGLDQPFVRPDFPNPRDRAVEIHGRYLELPAATSAAQPQHAVDFLIETLMASDGDITLVPVGPLSNIAMMLRMEPSLAGKIREMVIMGGAREDGNIPSSPMAEYNIWCDPEAARVVFHSGVPITLVPLDATRRALLGPDDYTRFDQIGTPAGTAAAIFSRKLAQFDTVHSSVPQGWVAMHDALAVSAVLDRSVISTRHVYVDVETFGEISIGQTVVDFYGRTGKAPNVHFAHDSDGPKFVSILMATLARTAG